MEKCIGSDGKESQLICNEGSDAFGRIKSRLVYTGKTPGGENYYKAEWKYVDDICPKTGIKLWTYFLDNKEKVNQWAWYLCGTEKFLNLSEQEKAWAK